ncbi:MAG: hypothetical protein KC912_06535 [Proteobacteria bacterium]|nr:hypothetical protein [Pseudomonadota bacterium]
MKRIALAIVVIVSTLSVWSSSDAEAARKRISFEETQITAEVQKPQVAVFISRENLHKGYRLELRESFIPRILESVERAPF